MVVPQDQCSIFPAPKRIVFSCLHQFCPRHCAHIGKTIKIVARYPIQAIEIEKFMGHSIERDDRDRDELVSVRLKGFDDSSASGRDQKARKSISCVIPAWFCYED